MSEVESLRDEVGMLRLLNDAYARERGTDFGAGYAAGYRAACASARERIEALSPRPTSRTYYEEGWLDHRAAVLAVFAAADVVQEVSE